MKGRSRGGFAILIAVAGMLLTQDVHAELVTSRLTPKALKVWNSVQAVALAVNKAGQPLHPTLRRLWEEASANPRAIYIEMPKPSGISPHTAGHFSVERPGRGSDEVAGLVQLYLESIDSAGTSELGRRPNGFLPFEGLDRKHLRYAEVVGHELVHALLTLSDAEHARLAEALDREMQELAAARVNRNGQGLDDETRTRLNRIEAMRQDVERRAEAVEVEVWRELRASIR